MDCDQCRQPFQPGDEIVTVPEYSYARPVDGELVPRRVKLPGEVTVHGQCARNYPHRFAKHVQGTGRLREP